MIILPLVLNNIINFKPFLITSMAKPVFVLLLPILSLILIIITSTNAATYMVGDNSGWDISTDFDTWAQDKIFAVGDVLVFQYASSHSVDEVTKDGYEGCNTTNVVRTFTNGNTTVPLTKPGSRYFVCGNKLHCLGGMKLQVNVQGNQANSPVSSPQAQPGDTTTNPSSKSNNPYVPTSSAGFIDHGRDALVSILPGFMATLLWMMQI